MTPPETAPNGDQDRVTTTAARQCPRECSEHHTFELPCLLATAGREPRGLRVSGSAPRGALPGCPGRIVLTIDKNNCGSWSTPCSLDLSLDCEAPGCWWSRNEWEGDVDAELFGVAASMHALDAYEEARDAD